MLKALTIVVAICSSNAVLRGGGEIQAAPDRKQPNIIVLLVDDYGWANWGLHQKQDTSTSPSAQQAKKEVHTPNLDALAEDGVVMDRHYAYSICSPSRCSLQSGRLAVHVNVKNTSPLVHNATDPVSGFQGIPRNMTTIARKMKDAGYRTAMTGKWDAGMATPQHTPQGRGYDEFYGYYQHANNYWTKGMDLPSTGEVDICLNKFTDLSYENASYRGGQIDARALDSSCSSSDALDPACYEEALFKEQGLKVIEEHDTSKPLFYFHSFHLIHSPLDVPQSYIEMADERVKPFAFDDAGRRNYSAMVHYMDDVVGELTGALKKKGMWENSLVVFMSDNGGPIYKVGSGNNHPLRGGKYSDFEGGIRTNSAIFGGFVPQHIRGSTYTGVVSIADWYGLFTDLAGVDQTDFAALEANKWLGPRGLPLLPPIDSTTGLWDAIVGGDNTNKRPVLHQSPNTLIEWPYKLVTGAVKYGSWTGELYPNCTSKAVFNSMPMYCDTKLFDVNLNVSNNPKKQAEEYWEHGCTDQGCLFNIETDPSEHEDLVQGQGHGSATAAWVEQKRASMLAKLADLNRQNFNPGRGEMSIAACDTAMDKGGYYGPFVDVETYYTGPFRSTAGFLGGEEQLARYEQQLRIANMPIVLEAAPKLVQRIFPFVATPLANHFDYCLPGKQPSTLSNIAHALTQDSLRLTGTFTAGLAKKASGMFGMTPEPEQQGDGDEGAGGLLGVLAEIAGGLGLVDL